MGNNIKRRITALLLTVLVSIVATGCAKSISEDTENSETVSATTTTESATAETTEKEGKITTAATTEQTTETTEASASTTTATTSTTEITVSQSTTESSTVQATTHAATEAPTTEHAHNWVIVTKTVEVPAETHTEVHYFRIDNGQEVPTNQVVGHQFADGIKECVQTGGYTVVECQCGFSGSSEEVAAHKKEHRGDDWIEHSRTMDHIEYTYAEVESRTITVVDQEATTIQIPAGYQCTICGEYRESTDVSSNDTIPWWRKIWGNISSVIN
ncbi:MAG: hypothetical protein IJ079_00910 [Lachnospiraceae bacterium]|nr:hypothetical protein [Lachnospiraceae bacterium]